MSTKAAEAVELGGSTNPSFRVTALLPELPARLLVSVVLVVGCCVVYLLFPFFEQSPRHFALLELAVFASGILAYHFLFRRKRDPFLTFGDARNAVRSPILASSSWALSLVVYALGLVAIAVPMFLFLIVVTTYGMAAKDMDTLKDGLILVWDATIFILVAIFLGLYRRRSDPSRDQSQ